jgi:hypothetical protein
MRGLGHGDVAAAVSSRLTFGRGGGPVDHAAVGVQPVDRLICLGGPVDYCKTWLGACR